MSRRARPRERGLRGATMEGGPAGRKQGERRWARPEAGLAACGGEGRRLRGGAGCPQAARPLTSGLLPEPRPAAVASGPLGRFSVLTARLAPHLLPRWALTRVLRMFRLARRGAPAPRGGLQPPGKHTSGRAPWWTVHLPGATVALQARGSQMCSRAGSAPLPSTLGACTSLWLTLCI